MFRKFQDLDIGKHIYSFNNNWDYPQKIISRIVSILGIENGIISLEIQKITLSTTLVVYLPVTKSSYYYGSLCYTFFTTKKEYNQSISVEIINRIQLLTNLILK